MKEVKKTGEKKNRPSCFKCDADLSSFTFIDYPLSDKLLMVVFCSKCGAVQGMVASKT